MTTEVDLDTAKQGQRAMWGTANYASVGTRIMLVSELLCEAVDLQGGERVLDVACGTGNAALAAARRFADVTGADYQPRLLEIARQRAAAEGLDVDFREADAEALPFDDASFDAVLSACGAMFAPDQERTASELLRVCRPGGRIGMVNWTPTSWVAEVGRTVGRYVPPPPGVPSPVQWGDAARLRELFGDDVEIEAPRRTFLFRFPSASDHVEYFAADYPPIAAALSRIGESDAHRLRRDLLDLAHSFDTSSGDGLVLPLDYLEVVVRKP
ncbi:MAG: class I SAM-dependent methyltransferase, partial [Acidimicrobiia bacterium]